MGIAQQVKNSDRGPVVSGEPTQPSLAAPLHGCDVEALSQRFDVFHAPCEEARFAALAPHALLLLTEREESCRRSLMRLHHLVQLPVLVGSRNLYDSGAARRAVPEYLSIGGDGTINPPFTLLWKRG
jgi:hypothetical protein